jgi:hypothetical protein
MKDRDILDDKTQEELLQSTVAELAKATNELRCIENDAKKASNRLRFLIVVVNKLLNRSGDKQ